MAKPCLRVTNGEWPSSVRLLIHVCHSVIYLTRFHTVCTLTYQFNTSCLFVSSTIILHPHPNCSLTRKRYFHTGSLPHLWYALSALSRFWIPIQPVSSTTTISMKGQQILSWTEAQLLKSTRCFFPDFLKALQPGILYQKVLRYKNLQLAQGQRGRCMELKLELQRKRQGSIY